MSPSYNFVSSSQSQSWMPSFLPFSPLYCLPGGPHQDRTSGEGWVLLFEVEHLWKRGPTQPEWQSPPAWQTSSWQFARFLRGCFQPPQAPSLSGPPSLPIQLKLELFSCEPVIKTRQPATEVSCLGYRRAAGVEGHVGFEFPFVGRDWPHEEGSRPKSG